MIQVEGGVWGGGDGLDVAKAAAVEEGNPPPQNLCAHKKKKKKKKKKKLLGGGCSCFGFFFFFGFVKGAGWERERPWPTKRPFGGSVLSALTGGLKKTCVARARYGGGQVMPAEQRGQAESPWWEE